MAKKNAPESSSFGLLHKLGVLFVAVTIAGIVIGISMILTPQSLEDIDGLEATDGGRDVSIVIHESQNRQIPVTLTEAEINQWLARSLEIEQSGKYEDALDFKHVAVRIREDLIEVIMVREYHGKAFTVSMFLTVDQSEENDRIQTVLNLHGGRYAGWFPGPPRGGRFGKLVMPQGFLRLIMPAYESLADAVADELDLGFKKMVKIKLGDRKIELDPRVPKRAAEEI